MVQIEKNRRSMQTNSFKLKLSTPLKGRTPELGPCIPNLNSKFRVGFRVGTSFRESRRVERHFFVPTLIFGKRLVLTRFSCFFAIFSRIFAKARKTRLDSNFR